MIARSANPALLLFRLALAFVAIMIGLLLGLAQAEQNLAAGAALAVAVFLAAFTGLAKTSSA